MKKIKKLTAVCMAACLSGTLLSIAACSGTAVSNDEQTLEIFVSNYGYGYEWLNDQIALFKEQEWVKNKYPNLNIPEPAHNSDRSYCLTRITAGSVNTVDLFFSCESSGSYIFTTDSNGNSYFEDLTAGVYDTLVPGETDVYVKDKMIGEIYDETARRLDDGTTARYGMPWVDGFMGLLYNKTLVQNKLGVDYVMPRTTNELVQMTVDLKKEEANSPALTPFIFSSSANYWSEMFLTWWAQYEGMDNYRDYWMGTKDGEYSSEIFEQKGRLRSLEVIESLINRPLNNNHAMSTVGSFSQMQSKFILGEGVFMPNGDWFEMEMRSQQSKYEITFLKTPVVSAITEKCTGVKDDAALAFVVQCVDEGKNFEQAAAAYDAAKSSFEAASQNELLESDFEMISNARNTMHRLEGHEAYIPSYASAKELAKDFLRFMATDISIRQFGKSTGGALTAFRYTPIQAELSSYTILQQDHYKYWSTGIQIPTYTSFKLYYHGGLIPLKMQHEVDNAFAAQNAADRKSAQRIYDDDISYYQSNNNANFINMLVNAGIR